VNRRGFTLLEVIVVIIIVGVLAGVALPRFSSFIEASYAAEALASMRVLHDAVQRCHLWGGEKNDCKMVNGHLAPFFAVSGNPSNIDDPSLVPNAKFYYAAFYQGTRHGGTSSDLSMHAFRKLPNGSYDAQNRIYLLYRGDGQVWRYGWGYYESLINHLCWFRGCAN